MPFPFFLLFPPFFFTWDSFVIFVQVAQEVFVVAEWVKDARNKTRVEANLRAKVNNSLGAMKQKKPRVGRLVDC